MKIDQWSPDLSPLLAYMEANGCVELSFSDLKIGEGDPDLPLDFDLQRFTAGLPGHVEIEFWIRNRKVIHLQVRQAAMTMKELQMNGEVLPNINVAVNTLPLEQQKLVQSLAGRFLCEDKAIVQEEVQRTLIAMAEKVLFNPPWSVSGHNTTKTLLS